MIELTVKTLDSQNHQFSVEDDITVEQFKAKIAETVNIPPETQRIIYCGRVLQDSTKLADYDVNGKVVHLVQSAPPGTIPRPSSRSASPQPQRRGFREFRGLEQGNAMYLGSMAFPSNLMESQGIVPPPPTHSLSGSRLNVAKRMLRRAEVAIRLLENPSSRPQEQTPSEENQEEEVTPVIEARVIVPANNSEPIDENMVLNAVQNSLMNATTGAIPLGETTSSEASGSGTQSNTETTQRSPEHSSSSTPGRDTPRSSSTENLTSQSRSENSSGLPENASRTAKMAELLTMLGQLQTRFAPFLARYQTFMQDDPEVAAENASQTQIMLNRVSEVLHFLGHAYHSLSDILIRVRTPPPRPLLCRPILIQQSTVVQTGIPIQVEAQINLSADRPPTTSSNQTSTENSGSTTATPNTNANTSTTSGGPTISVQPGFVGLPFLPGTAMRVQSFPVEIRAMRSAAPTPRPQNNNNNTVNSSNGSAGSTQPMNDSVPSTGTNNSQQNGHSVNFNNPNVEFFMEVTPEGITIDSLETTLVGSNQANDFLRGALNGPPPEFLQSLMQMAGQIINGNATTTPSTTTTPADSAQSTQQSNATQAAPTTAGQNSQARGNTQTNPTTATYTLPTPRPHVHLAQQAMQGGFDPFLPCNSHHIARRVYPGHATAGPTAANQQNASQNNPTRQEAPPSGRGIPGQNPNILNFINGIFDSISTEYRRANESAAQAATPSSTASAPPGDQAVNSNTAPTSNIPNLPSFASFFSNLQSGGNLSDLIRQGPTLDQQEFTQNEQTVHGGSIITDFILLLCGNVTLDDFFSRNNGNVEYINRNRTEIQNFFRMRVCDGDITSAGVYRGIEKLITELQPFFESFRSVAVYRDIDLVRSVEQVFRQRLPNIINIAIHLNDANSVRLLFDRCITTVKHICDLIVNSCIDDVSGLDEVYERFRYQFLQNIPEEERSWTTRTCYSYYRQVMTQHANAPESTLQSYIVRRSESSIPSGGHRNDGGDTNLHSNNPTQQVEAMDTTNRSAFSKDLRPATTILADTEPLPNIVLGSDTWHNQVLEDWVPIIARDAQKQRRQNPQGPFSDAYLSGMPNKRRKIVNSSKPQGSLPQVISESIRQAVTATGLTSVAPLETVTQAAGASSEIQAAYRSLLRTSVQDSLRDNEDFTPERFPNASNYFNNTQ